MKPIRTLYPDEEQIPVTDDYATKVLRILRQYGPVEVDGDKMLIRYQLEPPQLEKVCKRVVGLIDAIGRGL